VSACGVIHNFICTFNPNDELDPLDDEANALQAQDGGDQFLGGTGDIHGTETHQATEKRETIAQAMWPWIPGRDSKVGCDGTLKVDIVDIGQKKGLDGLFTLVDTWVN